MTRGEIWKDFFKKTVLTVIVAGFSSCFPQSRRSIPRGFSPSVSSWLVAPFCLQDFCLGRLLGIIHHLHIASHLWNRFSSANPFSFSVSLSVNGVFNLDDVGKFCPSSACILIGFLLTFNHHCFVVATTVPAVCLSIKYPPFAHLEKE